MKLEHIKRNIEKILKEIPGNVTLVAIAKTRTPDEVREVAASGVRVIGENYIQEAQDAVSHVGHEVRWHFVGHLQKNKVKKAAEIFDMIETIDSFDLAKEVDKRCGAIGKVMPVLVEVNSGREAQKFGVFPEKTAELITAIANLDNIKVMGLMTMGPFSGDPEDARPYFRETKETFDKVRASNIAGVEMKYLSMGMTNSYRVAIEEGANIIRVGTKIFGERNK